MSVCTEISRNTAQTEFKQTPNNWENLQLGAPIFLFRTEGLINQVINLNVLLRHKRSNTIKMATQQSDAVLEVTTHGSSEFSSVKDTDIMLR